MNNRGSVEVLLLLCCLVGGITFICFATCAVRVKAMQEEAKARGELSARNLRQLEEMKARTEQLRQRIAQKEKELAAREDALLKGEQNKTTLAELERQVTGLEEELQARQTELARRQTQLVAPEKREQYEKTLAETKARIQELERRLEEKRVLLQALKNGPAEQKALEEEIRRLRQQLAEAEQEIKRLAEEAKDTDNLFDPSRIGAGYYKRPLYVECAGKKIKIWPRGEEVDVGKLPENNLFAAQKTACDVIVLLVRPNGFGSFADVLAKAQETGLPVCYEPVRSEENLGSRTAKEATR